MKVLEPYITIRPHFASPALIASARHQPCP
jgi:hypothetical protein